jgi:hypothetical protein
LDADMLLKEQFLDADGDKFVIKKTFDTTNTTDTVKQMRDLGVGNGESKHIGRVPGWMISEWLKEAGVKWSDIAARDEVVKNKMMSGEFAAFRNWQGTY